MAKKKKGKKKGRVISVDFTGVKSGGTKVPEGDYLVKVKEVKEEIGSQSGKPYLEWVLEVTEGKYKGKVLYHKTSLQPQALFNLRNTLEALNIEVPDSITDINLDDLVDYELGVGVEVETFEGQKRSRVVDVFPADELDGDEEDEDEEDEDEEDEEDGDEEDEDEEDEDEEDYEDMEPSELKALCKERGIKVPKKAKKAKLIELLEEDDEEDDE